MRFSGTMQVRFEIEIHPSEHGKDRSTLTSEYVKGVVAERARSVWEGITLEVVDVQDIRRED